MPSPGAVRIAAVPPCRRIRSTMLLRTPSRSVGTSRSSKPRPRSRTKTSVAPGGALGVDVDLVGARVLGRVDHRLAGGEHQRPDPLGHRRVADGDHLDRARRGCPRPRPPPPAGHRPPRCRAAAARRTARTAGRAPGPGPGWRPCRLSPACFWIRARVCSTESCRCAAMSARSCERTRAARSSDRSPVSRNSHGPTISARPATPSAPAITTSRATPNWPDCRPVCSANSTSAETSRPTPAASRA